MPILKDTSIVYKGNVPDLRSDEARNQMRDGDVVGFALTEEINGYILWRDVWDTDCGSWQFEKFYDRGAKNEAIEAAVMGVETARIERSMVKK